MDDLQQADVGAHQAAQQADTEDDQVLAAPHHEHQPLVAAPVAGGICRII